MKEDYRWWEDLTKGDGTKKWITLEHISVVFPPPYESLPNKIWMRYNKIPVTIALAAKEVAGFPISEFRELLEETGGRLRHQWRW
jgi:DNA topoisomerase-1